MSVQPNRERRFRDHVATDDSNQHKIDGATAERQIDDAPDYGADVVRKRELVGRIQDTGHLKRKCKAGQEVSDSQVDHQDIGRRTKSWGEEDADDDETIAKNAEDGREDVYCRDDD